MRFLMAVTCLLLLAPTAEAASFSVEANVATSESRQLADSIALADGVVLWMEQRGTGAALVAAGMDGTPRDVATLPPVAGPRRFHAVVASGTATAFDVCLGDPACKTPAGCPPGSASAPACSACATAGARPRSPTSPTGRCAGSTAGSSPLPARSPPS